MDMEHSNKLSLLVSTYGRRYGIDRAGAVLRCSRLPGYQTDFEKTVFQQVIWPGENSSDEEWEIAEILTNKLMERENCPAPSIEFPFQEVVKEQDKLAATNRSFIHFDFCGLPKEMISGILCRETAYRPINCDELTVIVDDRGIDKRFAEKRFLKEHRRIDVIDPKLHAHSCARECYLENEAIDYAASTD